MPTLATFFFNYTHGMWKFLSQGSNLGHSNDDAESSTYCATKKLPLATFIILEVIDKEIRQEKEIKKHPNWKGKNNNSCSEGLKSSP